MAVVFYLLIILLVFLFIKFHKQWGEAFDIGDTFDYKGPPATKNPDVAFACRMRCPRSSCAYAGRCLIYS